MTNIVKGTGIGWLLLVMPLILPNVVLATKPIRQLDSLKLEMHLLLPDTIILNEPFDVTFSVTVFDSVHHFEDSIDVVGIGLPWGCKLVSGSTSWGGTLSMGKTVTVQAKAVFTTPRIESIEGYVLSGRIGRVYHTRNRVVSREYIVAGSPDYIKPIGPGMEGATIRDTCFAGPPPSASGEQSKPSIKLNRHMVIIRGGKVDGNGVYQLSRSTKNTFVFMVEDSLGITHRALIRDWRLSCESCSLHVNSDSTASLFLDDSVDSASLEFRTGGVQYTIRVHVAQTSTVTGYFRYVDNFGDTLSGYGTYVELYYKSGSDWVISDTQLVGPDGRYLLHTDRDTMKIVFWSFNYSSMVPYSDQCFSPGDPLYLYTRSLSGWTLWNPGGVNEMDTYYTTIVNLDWAGAFNIMSWLQRAADYARTCCGDPEFVVVRWGRHCTADRSQYNPQSGMTVPLFGVEEPAFLMTIASKGGGGWDEWDLHVILHEYGHHFQNIFADTPDSSFGDHYYHAPTDNPSAVNEHQAWSEGFADIFKSFVTNSGQYVDYDSRDSIYMYYDYEFPQPDVPYSPSDEQTAPSSDSAFWDGEKCEGAIIEALWDIYDCYDDDNYYKGGHIWGHNNDHNCSDSWVGDQAIVDVLVNYDPLPEDPSHDHPWDIFEFTSGWIALGYPLSSHYRDILHSHDIPLCGWVPGDANGDGGIDIGDAVYLIRRIFSGGPAPVPHPTGSGDFNGDHSVDINDAVCVISYVFSGGAGPTETCEDYYTIGLLSFSPQHQLLVSLYRLTKSCRS